VTGVSDVSVMGANAGDAGAVAERRPLLRVCR